MEAGPAEPQERPVVDAEVALRFLAEASTMLAASLDYEDTVKRVTELVVPVVADWCAVEVLEEDGTTRQITSGLEDPELDEFRREFRRVWDARADQSQSVSWALERGEPVLVREMPQDVVGALDERARELYDRFAPQSYMIVPLIARGRTLGALVLLSRTPGRHFGSMDLAFAEHLGRRFALAIDNARLYQREREARAAAEAAERRARFLAEASVLMDASLDYETTLENVARLAVGQMADWVGVQVREPTGALRPVATLHRDPAKVKIAQEMYARFPPDPESPTGAANVARTGQSEIYPEVSLELLERAARDAEHLELIRALDLRSAMVVPMKARGRTLGVLTFALSSDSGRRYDETDLALAEELARRAGMAVDNARLYTELSGIADTLQAELLPTEIPEIPGIEVAVRYRAAGELNRVGGDFYDVFGRGPNEWVVVVGDVSGKGAPAAAVTALARYTLRTAVTSAEKPSDALDALNDALLERRRDQEFCSVALVFMRLGETGLEATISLGGHHPALVRRADGSLEAAGRPGMLLGFAGNPPLDDVVVELGPGDTLLLYTDGVTDADNRGDRFGDERLRRLIGALPADETAGRIAEAVEETAVAHAADHPGDDMALVAVQVPPAFVRASQFELEGGPHAVARARAAVAELVRDHVDDDRLYDLQLLVSEVVTNAVRHGGARQGDKVDLRVALVGDQIRMEVRDPGPGFLDADPRPERPATDAGGGYGLYLVDLYSASWGVSAREGTCVWLELPAARAG